MATHLYPSYICQLDPNSFTTNNKIVWRKYDGFSKRLFRFSLPCFNCSANKSRTRLLKGRRWTGLLKSFNKTHVHKIIHSVQIYFNLFRGRMQHIHCGWVFLRDFERSIQIKNLNNFRIYFKTVLQCTNNEVASQLYAFNSMFGDPYACTVHIMRLATVKRKQSINNFHINK